MDYRKISYEIEEADSGKTVLSYLKARGYSSRVLAALKQNPYGITIGRKRVTVQKQLRRGDTLTVRIADRAGAVRIEPVELPLAVLYEDADLLVADKPPHQPTHPSIGYRGDTLANAVAWHLQAQGLPPVFRPVHRLDKDTSGVILLAKNAHSAGVLGADLKEHKVRRTYLAVLRGVPPQRRGTVDLPIARAPGSVIARRVDPAGSPAVTHYEVLETRGGLALVRLWLETGRTHQIRVHMAELGAPVAGDFLYGAEEPALGRQALHSATLDCTHPLTAAPLHFESPLPADIRRFYEGEPQ